MMQSWQKEIFLQQLPLSRESEELLDTAELKVNVLLCCTFYFFTIVILVEFTRI